MTPHGAPREQPAALRQRERRGRREARRPASFDSRDASLLRGDFLFLFLTARRRARARVCRPAKRAAIGQRDADAPRTKLASPDNSTARRRHRPRTTPPRRRRGDGEEEEEEEEEARRGAARRRYLLSCGSAPARRSSARGQPVAPEEVGRDSTTVVPSSRGKKIAS